MYDKNNVFARILRGEIPANVVLETPHSLVFHDISKRAKVHVLVIPKGEYVDLTDFAARASAAEKLDFFDAISKTADAMGIRENGYRAVANSGAHGSQEVPHLHFHILGGEQLAGGPK